jgi:site-specific recombinase XerD
MDLEQPHVLVSQVENYLLACNVEGKTQGTLRAYTENLKQFIAICQKERLPDRAEEFTPSDVYRYLDVIRKRGVSISTRHRRYRETRAFFSWCVRVGECKENPFDRIPNVRQEQKVIQPFSVEEIQRLLNACNDQTETGSRNKAIILLLLDTGIRASELNKLELQDLDLCHHRLHIRHGKGRRQRVASFGPSVEESIDRYVDKYRGSNPGRLFLTVETRNRKRRPMNTYLLGTTLKRLSVSLGIKANPHRFRHTFATWAIENSARELDVQYLLGHSTAFMVRRYSATYDAAKAGERHSEFSPAARLES